MSYSNEQSTIINEDVQTTRAIEKDSIDLIVTSPPYNVDIKYNSMTVRALIRTILFGIYENLS